MSSSENILRHKMPRRRHSDSFLSNKPLSNPTETNNLKQRLANKVQGISIDMDVVLGDENVSIPNNTQQSSYISPASVASLDQQPLPPLRSKTQTPTPVIGTTPVQDPALSLQPEPSSRDTAKKEPTTTTTTVSTQPSSNRLNLHNARAFATTRRSKILQKVSRRIARLREDKNDEHYIGSEVASQANLPEVDSLDTFQKPEQSLLCGPIKENVEKSLVNADCIPECHTEETALSSTLDGEVISDAQSAEALEIFVDEYPHDKFLSLLDLLRTNRVIQKLDIVRNRIDQGIRPRRTADLDHLFHILHILPGSLVELSLQNLRLQDLTSISLGLFDHNSIEHLQLTMESGTLDEETSKAIASIPNLVSIELEVRKSFPVGHLLKSKSLTILSVLSSNFVFEASHVITMADQLECNSTLQVLDLEPRIPVWCLVLLITALRSCSDSNGVSRLETFQFSCRTKDEKDGDGCMVEMVKLLLQQQSKLRVVWNHCFESFLVSEEIKDRVMSALYVCTTLQQFHVFMESKEYGAVKCRVLERNMLEWRETNGGEIGTLLFEL